MKTNQTHPPGRLRNFVTILRAMIERQHAPRSEGESRLLRRTLDEAEALAWKTGVPHLVFPALALEKIDLPRAAGRSLLRGHALAIALAATIPLFAGCGRNVTTERIVPPSVTVAPVEQRDIVEWDEFT